jgi:hypothetical protein
LKPATITFWKKSKKTNTPPFGFFRKKNSEKKAVLPPLVSEKSNTPPFGFVKKKILEKGSTPPFGFSDFFSGKRQYSPLWILEKAILPPYDCWEISWWWGLTEKVEREIGKLKFIKKER